MKNRKFYLCIALIGVFIAALMLTSCNKPVNSSEVRGYSDGITEKLLLDTNTDNYNEYAQQFSEDLRSLLTEDKVKSSDKLIRDKIGTYVEGSKKFVKAVKQSQNKKQYVVALYTAKFTNEPKDVTVTIVFSDDNTHSVSSFMLNSPKLRGK